MVVYEFYLLDQVKGNELVGILPERRKHTSRITKESVLHWAETVLGDELSNKNIYFIEVTITEYTGKLFRTPFLVTQRRVEK